MKASDQSLLLGLKSRDWSAFSQSCSCHRGLIIIIIIICDASGTFKVESSKLKPRNLKTKEGSLHHRSLLWGFVLKCMIDA